MQGELYLAGSGLPETRKEQNSDPNYSIVDGWYFRAWDRDLAWEFVRFVNGQMEVDHFFNGGGHTSSQGSSNFCCNSLNDRQARDCLPG